MSDKKYTYCHAIIMESEKLKENGEVSGERFYIYEELDVGMFDTFDDLLSYVPIQLEKSECFAPTVYDEEEAQSRRITSNVITDGDNYKLSKNEIEKKDNNNLYLTTVDIYISFAELSVPSNKELSEKFSIDNYY